MGALLWLSLALPIRENSAKTGGKQGLGFPWHQASDPASLLAQSEKYAA